MVFMETISVTGHLGTNIDPQLTRHERNYLHHYETILQVGDGVPFNPLKVQHDIFAARFRYDEITRPCPESVRHMVKPIISAILRSDNFYYTFHDGLLGNHLTTPCCNDPEHSGYRQ